MVILSIVSGLLEHAMQNRKYSLLAGIIPGFVDRVELSQDLLQRLLERAKEWRYSRQYGYTWVYYDDDSYWKRWRKKEDIITDPEYHWHPANIFYDEHFDNDRYDD